MKVSGRLPKQRWDEICAQFEESLGTKMPDFWIKLAEYVPWVMDGYAMMRERTFRDISAGGALSKKVKELIIVAMNILQGNIWGIYAHTRAAIRAGATPNEIAEVVALTILSRGMVAYRMGGYDALLAAEQAMAEQGKDVGGG
jgi:AhpD family alkylhydroperoxidase